MIGEFLLHLLSLDKDRFNGLLECVCFYGICGVREIIVFRGVAFGKRA